LIVTLEMCRSKKVAPTVSLLLCYIGRLHSISMLAMWVTYIVMFLLQPQKSQLNNESNHQQCINFSTNILSCKLPNTDIIWQTHIRTCWK